MQLNREHKRLYSIEKIELGGGPCESVPGRPQPMAQPMTAPPYRIGRARTGLGLFAIVPIRRGAVIVEYTGPRISTKEARARERERGARYMFEIDNRWTIDGSPRTNVARYANHACHPNAEAIDDRGRIYLRARHPIEPGEEITYDYGRAYFELFFTDGRCRCATCAPQDRKQ
jgi:SET domain-containing protein